MLCQLQCHHIPEGTCPLCLCSLLPFGIFFFSGNSFCSSELLQPFPATQLDYSLLQHGSLFSGFLFNTWYWQLILVSLLLYPAPGAPFIVAFGKFLVFLLVFVFM